LVGVLATTYIRAPGRYHPPATGLCPRRAFHHCPHHVPYAQQTARDNHWLPPCVYDSQSYIQARRETAQHAGPAGGRCAAGGHAAEMRRGPMADNLTSSDPEPTQAMGGGAGVTAQDLTKALKEVERSKRRRAFGRRALIVGAGAAACVGA